MQESRTLGERGGEREGGRGERGEGREGGGGKGVRRKGEGEWE